MEVVQAEKATLCVIDQLSVLSGCVVGCQGTLICGAVCVVIAVFLPFTTLDDMISAGAVIQLARGEGACDIVIIHFLQP